MNSPKNNQVPLPNPSDVLSLRPIDTDLLDKATLGANSASRHRQILRFHELLDHIQRMVNAIEPESYMQPHSHPAGKIEVSLCLRGRAVVIRFDEQGNILQRILVSAHGPVFGVEITPTSWHTLYSLEPGTVMFEVKEGPFDADTDKQPAFWAPPESDVEAGQSYLAKLREQSL